MVWWPQIITKTDFVKSASPLSTPTTVCIGKVPCSGKLAERWGGKTTYYHDPEMQKQANRLHAHPGFRHTGGWMEDLTKRYTAVKRRTAQIQQHGGSVSNNQSTSCSVPTGSVLCARARQGEWMHVWWNDEQASEQTGSFAAWVGERATAWGWMMRGGWTGLSGLGAMILSSTSAHSSISAHKPQTVSWR